jgi:tRNA (adenine37-N6)-methyltransferase
LEGKKTGVFATRSPHRYNPIGLSVAKLDKIDTHFMIGKKRYIALELSGIDLVHNTAILDVKPYHLADSVPMDILKTPSWISAHPRITVTFSPSSLDVLRNAFESGSLFFYRDYDSLLSAITECLQQDPRTIHSKSKSHQLYGISLDRLDICFRYDSMTDSLHVFQVSCIPESSPRPRMRTRIWLSSVHSSSS